MQRRGQERRPQFRLPSSRLDEGIALVPANLVFDADLAVEAEQVGAAAQQQVLAVVDRLRGAGKLVAGGASAKVGTPLVEPHAEAGVGQCATRSQPGESAACDRHRRLRRGAHPASRRQKPFESTPSFSQVESRIFSPKTS